MIILETAPLILRHLEMADLDALSRIYRDAEVRRYFPDGTLSYEDTRREIEWFMNGEPDYPQLGLWATLHKETGDFIGRCGLLPWTIDGRLEVEVAYLLAREYWGQGLGTEAAQAILDYGFGTLQLPRLICLIDQENQASISVARKIGMVYKQVVDPGDGLGPAPLYSIRNPRAVNRSTA